MCSAEQGAQANFFAAFVRIFGTIVGELVHGKSMGQADIDALLAECIWRVAPGVILCLSQNCLLQEFEWCSYSVMDCLHLVLQSFQANFVVTPQINLLYLIFVDLSIVILRQLVAAGSVFV